MIAVNGLTKRYGATIAVDDLTFEVSAARPHPTHAHVRAVTGSWSSRAAMECPLGRGPRGGADGIEVRDEVRGDVARA